MDGCYTSVWWLVWIKYSIHSLYFVFFQGQVTPLPMPAGVHMHLETYKLSSAVGENI